MGFRILLIFCHITIDIASFLHGLLGVDLNFNKKQKEIGQGYFLYFCPSFFFSAGINCEICTIVTRLRTRIVVMKEGGSGSLTNIREMRDSSGSGSETLA